MSNKKSYLNLLEDSLFLEWKFSATPELDAYWKKQQEEDSALADEIEKAEYFLKHRYFKNETLSSSERYALMQKILTSNQGETIVKKKKTTMVRFTQYAAILIAVLGIALLVTLLTQQNEMLDVSESNQIVGEIGNEKDIQLYIGDELLSYNQNVDIVVDESGVLSIDENVIDRKRAKAKEKELHKIIVPYGKRSKLKLSDNTVVWLNSGTTIEFPMLFDDKTREISIINGECYLEVSEDLSRPFFVITPEMKIKVLGTSFNVSAYDGEQSHVTLINGGVSVEAGQSEELILKPSEQAVLVDKNHFVKQKVDVSQFTSWRDGFLILENTSMTDLLTKVSRYYNISFNYGGFENFKKIKINGKLILSDKLDHVLQSISILSSTNYSVDDNIIYISNDN